MYPNIPVDRSPGSEAPWSLLGWVKEALKALLGSEFSRETQEVPQQIMPRTGVWRSLDCKNQFSCVLEKFIAGPTFLRMPVNEFPNTTSCSSADGWQKSFPKYASPSIWSAFPYEPFLAARLDAFSVNWKTFLTSCVSHLPCMGKHLLTFIIRDVPFELLVKLSISMHCIALYVGHCNTCPVYFYRVKSATTVSFLFKFSYSMLYAIEYICICCCVSLVLSWTFPVWHPGA